MMNRGRAERQRAGWHAGERDDPSGASPAGRATGLSFSLLMSVLLAAGASQVKGIADTGFLVALAETGFHLHSVPLVLAMLSDGLIEIAFECSET